MQLYFLFSLFLKNKKIENNTTVRNNDYRIRNTLYLCQNEYIKLKNQDTKVYD